MPISNNNYDVIVLGLGAMGSATLYQLAKRGVKVLGIDALSPPHTFGSTHGGSRVTRLAIGEGSSYVPIVMRSHEIWHELEAISGEDLMTNCGGLVIAKNGEKQGSSHNISNFLDETIGAAKEFGIEHEVLASKELARQFPQFKASGSEKAYYEPQAGFLRPEKCLEVQLKQAKQLGANIVLNSKVEEISFNEDSVLIKTQDHSFSAAKVALSLGAWISKFLPSSLKEKFAPYRQLQFWFELAIDKELEIFHHNSMPVYIVVAEAEEDGFYGFPIVDEKSSAIKIGLESYQTIVDPETVNREVSQEEVASCFNNISKLLPISNNCIKASSCLYTVTPDFKFAIDYHPEHQQAIIVSACSGHGFKHSAAIGEAVAEMLVDGKSRLDLSDFSFTRLLAT